MSYSYDPNMNPDEKNQDQSAPSLASGSQPVGGSSSTGGTGTSAGGAQSKSGNFQNLNSYLDANQGNNFGSQFTGKLNNDVNSAQSAQDAGAQEFKNTSDAGTVKQDPNVVNQALSDPYGFSQNPGNVQAFQKQYNANYSGPQTYQSDSDAYNKASGATQKAENSAQAAQTEPGRFALLDQYFSNPNYSQGQKSLDNLLVSSDPTTQSSINQARQNADAAQMNLQNQAPQLQQYAAGNMATTQATQAATQQAAQGAQTGLKTEYGNDLSNAQKQYQAATSANQAPSYANLSGLGYNADGSNVLAPQSTNFLGLNPQSYFTGLSGTAPTQSNVLSLAQQQKMDALQGLMGETPDVYDASQAGAYSNPQFNASQFTTDLKNAENSYNNQIAPWQQQMDMAEKYKNNAILGMESQNRYNEGLSQENALRLKYGLPQIAGSF